MLPRSGVPSCGSLLCLSAAFAMQSDQTLPERPSGLFASAAIQLADMRLTGIDARGDLRLRQAGADEVLDE